MTQQEFKIVLLYMMDAAAFGNKFSCGRDSQGRLYVINDNYTTYIYD